jgi:hypothetical protein
MSGWRRVKFASRDEVRRAGPNLHPTSSDRSRLFSAEQSAIKSLIVPEMAFSAVGGDEIVPYHLKVGIYLFPSLLTL